MTIGTVIKLKQEQIMVVSCQTIFMNNSRQLIWIKERRRPNTKKSQARSFVINQNIQAMALRKITRRLRTLAQLTNFMEPQKGQIKY